MIIVSANGRMVCHIVQTYLDWMSMPSIFLRCNISDRAIDLLSLSPINVPGFKFIRCFAMPFKGNFPLASCIVRSVQDLMHCMVNLLHPHGRRSSGVNESLLVEIYVVARVGLTVVLSNVRPHLRLHPRSHERVSWRQNRLMEEQKGPGRMGYGDYHEMVLL